MGSVVDDYCILTGDPLDKAAAVHSEYLEVLEAMC